MSQIHIPLYRRQDLLDCINGGEFDSARALIEDYGSIGDLDPTEQEIYSYINTLRANMPEAQADLESILSTHCEDCGNLNSECECDEDDWDEDECDDDCDSCDSYDECSIRH